VILPFFPVIFKKNSLDIGAIPIDWKTARFFLYGIIEDGNEESY
jgi:hypothetical protein